jgi:hypothetical protein
MSLLLVFCILILVLKSGWKKMKDFVLFVAGMTVGLLSGLWIYWCPHKQFRHELCSIWNLVSKRYKRGDEVTVQQGVDLMPVSPKGPIRCTTAPTKMIVAYDLGVESFFTSTGGHRRSRVLHATLAGHNEIPFLYNVPYHWLVSCSQ